MPIIAQKEGKAILGLHCQTGLTQGSERVVGTSGIVKSLGNVGVLQRAKASAIKVYRPRIAQSAQVFGPNPYEQGRACARQAMAELEGWRDSRLFIETWNEPSGQKGPDREKLLALVRGFSDECHQNEYLVAGFCFATGNPEEGDIYYFAGNNWGNCDSVGAHGYWGNAGFTDWNALRYRKFWDWSGHDMPPVLITEAGRDAIEGGQAGWKRCGLSHEQYQAELTQYRSILQADHDRGIPILGSTPFTWAPTPDWRAFDCEGFEDVVGDWEPDWSLMEGKVEEYTSPNHGPARAQTLGIVLHSTRGGTPTAAADYASAVNWFQNPASQVSAHAVVGPNGEVWHPIREEVEGWHAREMNQTHLGIELAQCGVGTWLSAAGIKAMARIVAGWCVKYNIPIEWSVSRGISEHRETAPGIAAGKSDIGAPFNRATFLDMVKREAQALTPAPALDFSRLRAYGEWAIARCNAGQEPRDKGAFVEHLRALGADASQPSRYGFPC